MRFGISLEAQEPLLWDEGWEWMKAGNGLKVGNEFQTGRGTAEFHDFFTPIEIGKEIAEKVLRPRFREHKRLKGDTPLRMLEPAVGSGNLIWWAMQIAHEEDIVLDLVVIDVQTDYLKYVYERIKRWPGAATTL